MRSIPLSSIKYLQIVMVLGVGCTDVNIDRHRTDEASKDNHRVASSSGQAGTDVLRHPATGEEAVIFAPFTTDLSSARVRRKAGSAQPPGEQVSSAEQEAIDFFGNDVKVIVSARELSNVTDNPGQGFASVSKLNDDQIAHIAKLENLEWVELKNAGLSDQNLRHFSGLTKLKYLDLSQNKLTDEGLRYLSGLNLIYLDLSGCEGITNEGLEILSSLSMLRHLRLGDGDNLTEEGFQHLAKLSNLQELSVSSENLNSFGLVYLKSLSSLKHLGIFTRSNKLPVDELLEHIPDFKSLKRLFVRNSLTLEDFHALTRANPHLSYQ
jgi:hypothetical protein